MEQTEESTIFVYTRIFVLAGSLIPTMAYDPSDGGTYLTLINKDPIDDELIDQSHGDNLRYILGLNIILLVFIQTRIELYKRKAKEGTNLRFVYIWIFPPLQ